ncbi:EAL domain-containing protein [Alkalihalobacillus sp. MEB130]|uniref:putative bifunctional diguanylate cyclase/phosphodiesterase n=1 Tax=Alkalihalobacillus sp. MEB130 TaxID=2976704 RepID=UPI0028DE280E|nr:EAL domain-containing protein [Alkalihalobacillus sp. MEB130]MDT8858886.1 EAL domain-containing protein [Alkalihalobacillus sp. MEB130]
MSIKKKLPLLFTSLVLCVLIANSVLHYERSKAKLLDFNEREINLITQEVSYQVENAKNGALYVEDMLARELRTASIAAKYALPPNYEDVTNEQLVQLADELMVSHITLLAETEDDIIGVKSSDLHEIDMSTNQWEFWYEAFQQLFLVTPVSVEEGLALENYWSGPTEVASSNPDHTDKWGYFHDGTTNYIINPYFRDEQVLEYEKLFGPANIMERFTDKLDGVLELTVFNPENFGQETIVRNFSGGNFIRIADQPIWYGTYEFENQDADVAMVEQAVKTGQPQNYTDEMNGKLVAKTFVPIDTDSQDPYVIGISYDYGLIQAELRDELMQHILLSIPFIVLVLVTSTIFSRSITRPIGYIDEKVNDIAQGNFGGEVILKRKDELGHLSQNVNALSKSLQSYITDLKKSQEVIQFQADHDPLTGLYNIRYFQEELTERMDQAKQTGEMLAVLFIDIDRFKDVNDTLGHAKGDQLIQLISERIKSCLPSESSILTRQGGDEFVILCSGLDEEKVIEKANRLVASINQPYVIGEHEVFVSASCGISLYPDHTDQVDTLMVYADRAMYAAKKLDGNQAVIYDEEISIEKNRKLRIEARLRKAIKEELVEVFYQPKIDARTNQLTGVEALLRWTDEELGFVSPDVFIGVAEETGLIHPLWEIAMKKACFQVAKWNKQREEPLSLAVNFSAKQFQDPCSLVKQVKDILAKYQLAPNYFEVEITESTLLFNTKETIRALENLQELGISISIDDFGKGYSSLSYLKSLPINCLKIDRSFIQDINEDQSNSEIAEAVMSLARTLHLDVIAEGVEKEYQKELLMKNQCYYMQGYLFSKPVSAEEFEQWWGGGTDSSSLSGV